VINAAILASGGLLVCPLREPAKLRLEAAGLSEFSEGSFSTPGLTALSQFTAKTGLLLLGNDPHRGAVGVGPVQCRKAALNCG
jgi:hypothetical protein